MTKRRKPIDPVAVHDHFDGSAHCVQCGGECKLTGAERLATDLVRWHMRILARQKWTLDSSTRDSLEKFGVDVDALWKMALAWAAEVEAILNRPRQEAGP